MDTRNCRAWIDRMPPGPARLHVTGEVQAPTPGHSAQLSVKTPQGINPDILLLDMRLVSQPGDWPQVLTWVEARFEKEIGSIGPNYTEVTIFDESGPIAKVKVEEAH